MPIKWKFPGAVVFAWHRSGATQLQLVGFAIGGLIVWYLGLKLPQVILDNPPLSSLAGVIIGGLAGLVVILILQLSWWLIAVLRSKLGTQMWPVLLMSFGVVLFGAGGVLLAIEAQKLPRTAYGIARQITAVDDAREIITGDLRLRSLQGAELVQEITNQVYQRGQLDADSDKKLIEFAAETDAALKRLQSLALRYEEYEYMRELVNFTKFNPSGVVGFAESLAKQITLYYSKDTTPYAIRMHFKDDAFWDGLREEMPKFGSWVTRSNENLKQMTRTLVDIPPPSPAH